MIVRIVIALFASFIGGFGYLAGLLRLTSALLVGFGALVSFFFGMLFLLPAGMEQAIFPATTRLPSIPFFLLGGLLLVQIYLLLKKSWPGATYEEADSGHFVCLVKGVLGYLGTVFVASLFWFPGDKVSDDIAGWLACGGSVLFLVGLIFSCIVLYNSSKGATDHHPDLMRRFVLAIFAFCQLDKAPLVVAYLLISERANTPLHTTATILALAGYMVIAGFLMRVTWDSRDPG